MKTRSASRKDFTLVLPAEITVLIFQCLIPTRFDYKNYDEQPQNLTATDNDTQQRSPRYQRPGREGEIEPGNTTEIVNQIDMMGGHDDEIDDDDDRMVHIFGDFFNDREEVRSMLHAVEREVERSAKKRQNKESDAEITKRTVNAARNIINASKVCKRWRHWTESNSLWAALCSVHWYNKQGLREYTNEAFSGSRFASLSKGLWEHPNGWKKAFRLIEIERKRIIPTKVDLIDAIWTFHYNGTFTEDMQNVINFQEDHLHFHDPFEHLDLSMPWIIMARGRVAVAQYEPLKVKRSEFNWGWHLHNRYVYLLTVSSYSFRRVLDNLLEQLERDNIKSNTNEISGKRVTRLRRRLRQNKPSRTELDYSGQNSSKGESAIRAYLVVEAERDTTWKQVRGEIIAEHWAQRPHVLESLQLGLMDDDMFDSTESDDDTFIDDDEDIEDWFDDDYDEEEDGFITE